MTLDTGVWIAIIGGAWTLIQIGDRLWGWKRGSQLREENRSDRSIPACAREIERLLVDSQATHANHFEAQKELANSIAELNRNVSQLVQAQRTEYETVRLRFEMLQRTLEKKE